MLVLEGKIKGEEWQYRLLDEAIRTAQFIRNKAIRFTGGYLKRKKVPITGTRGLIG